MSSLIMAAACASAPPEESVVGDYLTGRFAARTNEVGAAASAFENAQEEFDGTAEVLRSAFLYQLAAGEINAAAALASKLLENEEAQDDDLARLALAAQAIGDADYELANSVLSANAKETYLAAPMAILNAWVAAGDKGPEAGLKILAQREGETFRGFHPLHQALLFEKAGLNSEADTAHQLSLATFGGLVGVNAYGAFLERTGDDGAAEEFYNRVIGNGGVARIMALQGLKRVDRDKASRKFANVSPAQGSAIALHSFAQAILEQIEEQRNAAEKAGFRIGDPNYDMPLALIQMSLYLYPEFDHAQWLAGRILNIYGDSDSAIDMMKRIPSSSPFFEQAQIDIASGLLGLERTEEALKVLRDASRRPGAVDEARFQYANLLIAEQRFDDAIKVFDELIEELPADPPENAWRFFIARAAAYIDNDQWENAEKDLIRAVDIAPKQAVALNYLGYSWAERGENLERAFELIEQAVALEPNSGAYIDSLGWAYYQQGDYQNAVGHLEHAASLEPSDPTITDHLGDVYWRLGREIEAQYQWRHVLLLEPSEKLRASIEKKLQNGLPEISE
ncbi:tetratricopeptide repeat protein [Hyphococcus sp.]|uniref:tetratricopeptide repeat protein n=1 Tax=Hyphococcus sp. TaxID=2038636 RepID=UPI003CCBCB81